MRPVLEAEQRIARFTFHVKGALQFLCLPAQKKPPRASGAAFQIRGSYGILPAIVAGCILAGILAATMSTADSQLLAASSAFSENLVCRKPQ